MVLADNNNTQEDKKLSYRRETARQLPTSAFQFARNNFDSIRFTPKNRFELIRIDSIRQVYTSLLSDEKCGRGGGKLMPGHSVFLPLCLLL